MNGDKVRAGEKSMTNVERQSHAASISGAAVLLALSGLLILLGIVFQLAELGYGHVRPDNIWLFSVIASGIWNILSLRLNTPALQELFRFWPLLLVGFGLAIMVATRENRSRRFARSRTGDRYGE
jgi:hypothetical protein